MRRLFGTDTVLFRIMEKLMQLAEINLLFLLFSIPVVTIGASCTAMLSCLYDLELGEGRFTAGFFVRELKRSLSRSVRIWIPGALLLALLIYNVRFCFGSLDGMLRIVSCGFYGAVFFWVSGALIYYFSFLARTEEGVKLHLRNSMILSLAKFPAVLLMTVCVFSILVLLLMPGAVVIRLLPLILLFWFSSPMLVCVRLVIKTAGPHFPELFRKGEAAEE